MKSTRPTTLPARHVRGFPWTLDKRCQAAREIAADLWRLWQDLGGPEALSTQQLIMVERVAYLRRRVIEFESAVLDGKVPPFDAGVHSNLCNVLVGYLKALGLDRKARDARGLDAIRAEFSATSASLPTTQQPQPKTPEQPSQSVVVDLPGPAEPAACPRTGIPAMFCTCDLHKVDEAPRA